MQPTVLIFRLGSLGDTIMALPCFHAIRMAYLGHRIVLLTNVPVAGNAAPLMAILGSSGQFADAVIDYPVSLRSPFALWELAQKIRAENVLEAVYLMPQRSRRSVWRDWAFLRFAAGIGRIRCLPDSDDLRRCRVDAETGEVESEASRLARCCNELGPIDLHSRSSWDLMLSEAELARGDDVISGFGGRSYVAFNMGGKAKEKDWGISNWEQLRDLLQPVCRGGAMVVGAAEDHGRAEEFLSRWNVGPTINVCGSLSPREAGAAMRKASLFVGHDSGPLHLACSVGCPSVGLFGNYNRPKQWHPISSHVRILHEMSGLERIAPEAVLKEAREIVVQGG